METQIVEIAKRFNLEGGLISNLEKSVETQKVFEYVIEKSGLNSASKKVGNMLYSVATKLPVILEKYREKLAQEVGKGDISNSTQLDFAIEYLLQN
jgi:hypothetical protein